MTKSGHHEVRPPGIGSANSAQRKRILKCEDQTHVENDIFAEPRSKRSRRSPKLHDVSRPPDECSDSDPIAFCKQNSVAQDASSSASQLRTKDPIDFKRSPNRIIDALHKQEHDPPPVDPSSSEAWTQSDTGQATNCSTLSRSPVSATTVDHDKDDLSPLPAMDSQLSVGRITNEQLIREIKAIYSALVLVEAKAIQVDRAQAAAIKAHERGEIPKLEDHWKELVGVHRTLLHDHNDFFLASQHVEASPALKELAVKYSMPARLWKHGIHSFLELLRYRLPDSREYMTSFIYFAYQMMALLYETVPSFALIWMECAGDLSRYRMAIETDDKNDRDIWAATARDWYARTSERSPGVGRLYHHLAILARPFVLRQLYLYARSLTSMTPFSSARDSLSSILDPLVPQFDLADENPLDMEMKLARLVDILLHGRSLDKFSASLKDYGDSLLTWIESSGMRWREDGAHVAIVLIAAMFEFGSETSALRAALDGHLENQSILPEGKEAMQITTIGSIRSEDNGSYEFGTPALYLACHMFNKIFRTVLSSFAKDCKNPNLDVLPHVHIVLVFMLSIAPMLSQNKKSNVQSLFEEFPHQELARFLDALAQTNPSCNVQLERDTLSPGPGGACVLPEDHLLRGQVIAARYLPEDWFKEVTASDERTVEREDIVKARISRVLWLGHKLGAYWKLKPDPLSEVKLLKVTRFIVSNECMLLQHYEALSWYSGSIPVIIPSSVILSVRRQKSPVDEDTKRVTVATKALEMITWARSVNRDIQIWTASEDTIDEVTSKALEEPMNPDFEKEADEISPDAEFKRIERRMTDLKLTDGEHMEDMEDEPLYDEARSMIPEQKKVTIWTMKAFLSFWAGISRTSQTLDDPTSSMMPPSRAIITEEA